MDNKAFMCLTTKELDTIRGWGRCVSSEYGLTGWEKDFFNRLDIELKRRWELNGG